MKRNDAETIEEKEFRQQKESWKKEDRAATGLSVVICIIGIFMLLLTVFHIYGNVSPLKTHTVKTTGTIVSTSYRRENSDEEEFPDYTVTIRFTTDNGEEQTFRIAESPFSFFLKRTVAVRCLPDWNDPVPVGIIMWYLPAVRLLIGLLFILISYLIRRNVKKWNQ